MKHNTRTKIVATIGPASQKVSTLERMIKSGMRVARLNFSHGDYKSHAGMVRNIRKAARNVGIEVAILQDLQGPRIRIGNVPEDGVKVKKNSKVAFVSQAAYEKGVRGSIPLPIQYEQLYKDVKKGTMILIEDGTKRFRVERVKDKVIYCKTKTGGLVKSHKGINVLGVTLSVDVITKKDIKDIEFGQKQEVDYVALSFVKDDTDIKRLKKLIAKYQKKGVIIKTKTIAKVERREALENLDAIVDEVDGIMVARGDLGIEVSPQEVPVWQKTMIEKCLEQAKPVIVATQMLDSMIHSPQPTRAEVSDVANAVQDHTDAIMLSGESAMGKFPVEAVMMMTKVAGVMEESHYDDYLCGPLDVMGRRDSVALAACQIALQAMAKAALVFTKTGDSVRLLSRHRPELPIIALTPEKKTQRQLALSWGVIAQSVSEKVTVQSMIRQGIKYLQSQHMVKNGDLVIIAGSDPFGKVQELNAVRVIKVGESV